MDLPFWQVSRRESKKQSRGCLMLLHGTMPFRSHCSSNQHFLAETQQPKHCIIIPIRNNNSEQMIHCCPLHLLLSTAVLVTGKSCTKYLFSLKCMHPHAHASFPQNALLTLSISYRIHVFIHSLPVALCSIKCPGCQCSSVLHQDNCR